MPDTIPPPDGDAPNEIDVEFDRWAQASAKLLRRSVIERAEALRDSGIANTWKEVDEFWYEALIQDIDSGRLERLNRYMEICRTEMEERLRSEGEVKSPLDAIGGPLEPRSTPEPESNPADKPSKQGSRGKELTSVTPPLGSASDSIEIDLTEMMAAPDVEEEDDDDGEISPDDTRVSPTLPELSKTD